MIDRKDVEHVARLGRLALTEGELERMRGELAAILQYIEKLRAVDVEGVEPTSHAVPVVNVMREDEVEPPGDHETMMGNAPDRSGEFFRVPRIIED
ncbi:MAG TPA: Asp-tRNA(Asn)/Glu-tRNA(Gln) amidotransferase subunit GatC [Methylomirabilota bacterium]|nr:Asp-tRNA(Asn)/Glu-tRNA(Gln) amidotransferase subunit GatC [Methylomirabilota bacterium]